MDLHAKPIAAGALCVALALLAPERAWAEDNVAQAKVLFDVGAKAYTQGQFPAAIQAFEQAHKLAPRPAIVFSLAQALRKQYYVDKSPENLRRALSAYRDYLSQVPDGGRRVEAAEQIAVLEPIAEKLGAAGSPGGSSVRTTRIMISSSTEGALIAIDGDKPSPSPRFVETKAGKHSVAITAPGHDSQTRSFELDEGAVFALDLSLKEQPSRISVDSRGGASVSIDGRYVATTPLATPIQIPSGSHIVTVSKNGFKVFTDEVPLRPGTTEHVSAPLSPTGQRIAAYTLFSLGAASFITGGVFTGLAISSETKAQDILAASAKGNADPGEILSYERALTRRDERGGSAALAFSASAISVVLGALLYSFDSPTIERKPTQPKPTTPKDTPSSELIALPVISPQSFGASIVGKF